MELGAPVLDVQVKKVTSATSKEAVAAAPKVESVIQDGVVTADGYEPIMITATATNIIEKPREFVPNVDIYTQETIYANNVVVEQEVEVAQDVTVITQETQQKTIVVNASQKGSVSILLVGVAILAGLCMAACCRQMVMRKR